MKLAFVISSLRTGGAERVLTRLATSFADQGNDVTIITLSEDVTSYYVSPRVNCVSLRLATQSKTTVHGFLNGARRLFALRRAIRSVSASAILSFVDTTNVLTILASRGLRV